MCLQNHVLKDTELKDSQIRAALGLLNKCIPDLQRTELTGDSANPDAPIMRIEFVKADAK